MVRESLAILLFRHLLFETMAIVDIIIVFLMVLGAILGFMKGFIKQLATLLGLIAGLLAAKALYVNLAEKLSPVFNDSMTLAQVIAFIAIWVAVPLIFSLIASMLTKALEIISLGWLNRWLGAGLGALKYLLLSSILICVFEFIDADNKLITKTLKQESVLYYPMKDFAGLFFPAAKQVTEHILNE